MQVIGMILKMNHLYLPTILGHEDIDITIHRITMIAGADYLKYPRCFATHIMEVGKKIEVLQAGNAQHRPSNFSTKLFNS